jgi:SPP1 gp7 family putative phage head morphogenesis protein
VTDVITFSGEFRPGAARLPQPSPEWHLKFLTAEADSTARLMGFYENARLELETFIRTGDLTQSDARFYRDLLDETNRIATDLNKNGAVWVSSTIPEAYTAGRRLTSSVVIPQDALSALSREPLALITQTTEQMRNGIRQTIASGILEGLPASELRARMLAGGLTNIPHWPSAEYRAGVIARTETMRAFNAGNLEGLKENGARYVRWIASPDEATCDICLPREGQVFRLSGTDPGEPYPDAPLLDDPPAHPRCRCTVRAEYRDPSGEVMRNEPGQPPPIEVEPVLSTGDMGADSPPMMPPAAGDLRKALAQIANPQIIDDLYYRRGASVVNPGTGLDDALRVQLRDEAIAQLNALEKFWRNLDLDDASMRIIAGMEGGTAAAARRQMRSVWKLRYGVDFDASKPWSAPTMYSSLKAVEVVRAANPRWVVDSPYLRYWGSAPALARKMSGSRAAEMYATGHMRPNFSAIKSYANHVDGYNLGIEDTILNVLVHELGHGVHNRYGLHQRQGYKGIEWGDDLYEQIAAAGKWEDEWRALRNETKGRVAPGEKDTLDALRTKIRNYEERAKDPVSGGYWDGRLPTLRKELEAAERLAREGPSGEWYPTDYARKGGYAEDFAESFMLYLLNPKRLKKWSPGRYEFMRKNVFGDAP